MAANGQIVTLATTATLLFRVVDRETYIAKGYSVGANPNIFISSSTNDPLPVLMIFPATPNIFLGGSTVTNSGGTIGALVPASYTLAYNCVGGDAPDTTANPLMKINRTINLAPGGVTGDGGEQLAGITSVVTGIAANQVQPVGVYGGATDAGTAGSPADACGVYGAARIIGSGTGVAIGGNFSARAGGTSASKASGLQITPYNATGINTTVAVAGFSQINGIWLNANGPNTCSVGLELGNPNGTQFVSGIHFNAQVNNALTGPCLTTSIQDDCSSATSILINGSHATAAVAVKAGSGAIIVGGTALQQASSLLEVQAGAGNANPLVYFGSTANGAAYRLKIGNSSGNGDLFVSGGTNNVLTGSAAGDIGLTNAAKRILLGGSAIVVSVASANTIGFFTAAGSEVAQQATTGTSTGTSAGSGTTFTTTGTATGGTGSSAYTIGDIVLALKHYGLLAA